MGRSSTSYQAGYERSIKLYRITISSPQLTFYGTNLKQGRQLMQSLARMVPSTADVELAEVEHPVAPHLTPWSEIIWDKSKFTVRRKFRVGQWYSGAPPRTIEMLDVMEGCAQMYTPKEKERTYRKVVARHAYINPADLTQLADYIFAKRSELPLGRSIAQDRKRLGRPKVPASKKKRPSVVRYPNGVERRVPSDDHRYRM